MTSIIYCPDCGWINDVVGEGKIHTQLHDSPEKERVESIIEELGVESIDESGCAFLTISAYDGELTEYKVAATGAPMMATNSNNDPIECYKCNSEPIKRMLLLVEVVDEEQRLLILNCDECGFQPEMSSDWDFKVRETETATIHEWYCPKCSGGMMDVLSGRIICRMKVW